jgi:hypothetical protein
MNAESEAAATHAPDGQPRPRRARWLMLAALLCVVGGFGSYYGLMANDFVRRTGVPAFPIMVAGCIVAIMAVARRPGVLTGVTLLACLGATGFVGKFLYTPNLPGSQSLPAIGDTAPGFELTAHDGRTVRLSDYRGQGPVLLVFYRGFW